MKSYRIALIVFCLTLLSAGVASADTLFSYSLSGPVNITFDLPVNPTPTVFTLGTDFQVTPLNLMVNGAPSSAFVVFFNDSDGGAFGVFISGTGAIVNLAGPQMYTGSESAPTMLAFNGQGLTDFDTGAPAGTVTSGPVSTPEPSSIVMLAVGMLVMGITVSWLKSRAPAVPLA